ncbi:MAG TPA: S9 family peptidase [Edaphobacter sp.]|nr:S9 family peptidase [Edaphobacter sp.]
MRAKNVIVVMVCLLLSSALFAQKRNITEKDIFSFTWIGDTQLAPDGSRAVYVQTTVNAKRDGYDTALYLLDTGQPMTPARRLTNGPHDAQPRWSPDGTQIAFTRAMEKEGKPQPAQLYLLSLAGGEPVQVSGMEKGVGSPQWSPNGSYIAALSETAIVPEAKAEKKDAAKSEEHKSDVRIITKAVYRNNGTGYLDTKDVEQMYVFNVAEVGAKPVTARQMTAGRFAVEGFVWHPSSGQIYYTSEHVDEPYFDLPHNEIYRVDVASGGAESGEKTVPMSALVAKLTFDASGLAISPDGRRVAFHGEEQPLAKPRSHQQADLFVMDIDKAQSGPVTSPPRNLTANYDYEVGGGVGGDNTAPRGGGRGGLVWTPDGKAIVDVVGKRGSALLVSIDAVTGAVKELTAEKQAVVGFSVKADGTKMLALISTPVNIGDLFSVAADGSKQQTQLTEVNKALFSQLNLTTPEDIQVVPTANAKDIAGSRIESFVQLPPDFDKSKKYPLILNIHGGPHSAYGWVFDHEIQWMAAKGYVVVYPNPRGSTTYGQQFANVIQHNYPGDDFHDLMDCVDAVVKLGYVDPAKMGVTGGSGGGLLTDWTVTQTARFKAAVAQRDIADWTNWWYTADFTLFQPTWFEGAPFDKVEEFRKYSPITYIKNVQTPMLFILGEADYRTPPTGGGEDFFRALKYRHIDTVMVRFPGESHELSRSGQPWHRVERLENIVNWFDKYLMGMPEPQYDIVPAGATAASVKGN